MQEIHPSSFMQYATCPAWIYHDLFSDPSLKSEISELALKLMEQGVLHEHEYVKDLDLIEVAELERDTAVERTLQLMEEGANLIYQGYIQAEIAGKLWYGKPDLLEKIPQESSLGNWSYMPVEIKSSKEPKPEHELQLAFYANILEKIQDVRLEEATIVNVDKERITVSIDDKLLAKLYDRINDIASIMGGGKPALHYRSKCKESPWGHLCLKDCEAVDDVALVYCITTPTLEKLREGGIETLQELAVENENEAKFKIATDTWRRIVLQAKSVKSGELIWISETSVLDTEVYKIYFDIEGDPLLGIEYMFGFWLGEDQKFKYFLAEKPEEEEKMWREFLEWLKVLPDQCAIYHYSAYEKSALSKLEEKYGGSRELVIFREKLVDLFDRVRDTVIFPLYFYSIKDLAKSKFVSYKWRHQKAGGAQSIFWYEKWLETGDREVLQDIINYNEDDVIATECLHQWLEDPTRDITIQGK